MKKLQVKLNSVKVKVEMVVELGNGQTIPINEHQYAYWCSPVFDLLPAIWDSAQHPNVLIDSPDNALGKETEEAFQEVYRLAKNKLREIFHREVHFAREDLEHAVINGRKLKIVNERATGRHRIAEEKEDD